MKIEEFKHIIESDLYNGMPIIFTHVSRCPYLVHQYLNQIKKDNHLDILYVDKVSDIPEESFFSTQESLFYVCCLKSDGDLKSLARLENCAFLIDSESKNPDRADAYIIDIPELSSWQVEDYIKSQVPEITAPQVQDLLAQTSGDLFALDQELYKITSFPENARADIIERVLYPSDIYGSIFELVNAIIKKDQPHIRKIYNTIEAMNINPISLASLLHSNYRNIIRVQLSPNATPENAGLKPNQFWAIKKNIAGLLTKEELVAAFNLTGSIELLIKENKLPSSIAIDYLITGIYKI